eukprot:1006524-Prorocentrum_minimum.AAC.1
MDTVNKKLKDVEEISRETKKWAKASADGVTANTVTLGNLTPGIREGFGKVLDGQQALRSGQIEIKASQQTGLETLQIMQQLLQ